MSDATPAAPAATISPVPTDEEAAAIIAAIQVGLPGGSSDPLSTPVSRWRFSGRWWSRPVPVRRPRPRG